MKDKSPAIPAKALAVFWFVVAFVMLSLSFSQFGEAQASPAAPYIALALTALGFFFAWKFSTKAQALKTASND